MRKDTIFLRQQAIGKRFATLLPVAYCLLPIACCLKQKRDAISDIPCHIVHRESSRD